jgi:hypothetical protein
MSSKTLLPFLCCLTLFTGCANNSGNSGFLQDPKLMSAQEGSPFQRTYWNRKFDPASYTQLYVAPVNTDYVMAQAFWEKASRAGVDREQVKQDAAAIALYTRDSFIRTATDDPKHRFTVVDNPGKQTLILELAIVQLVPSKAVLNAIGYPTWVPGSIALGRRTLFESQDAGKGTVAIEGRVRDGATGEVIGMFSDTRHPATAIIDLRALNWWAPARAIIDRWSQELIALANRPAGTVIKDAPPFELLVW